MEPNFNNTLEPQTPQAQSAKPKSNTTKWIIGSLVAFLVVAGAFRLGYVSGSRGFTIDTKKFLVTNKADQPTIVDYNLLWKALDIVQSKYIDSEHIDQEKVLYGAIRGAISAAGDEYTEFFDPESYSEFKTGLQGSFSGIGAEIDKQDQALIVIAPLPDSPAEKAGIQAQDFILEINGESTEDMTAEEAANKIRGEVGTEVTLKMYREGQSAPFDLKITRQKIEIKSVTHSYKDFNGKKIAVIKISRFGDDTENLLHAVIMDIQRNNPAGIIVDVRNNPGGYLDTSVEVASEWLDKGTLVVKEEHSEKDVTLYNSTGANRLGKFKTVVLMDGGSASAAEILSGALKDNGKAMLIGTKSFGKGSVQELIQLGETMAVKVTIAKWITPSGKNIDKDGLNPDIEVNISDEDIAAGRDPQMDRALQEITK